MESVKGFFAQRVKECRENMGMSQAQLADAAGTSATTIVSIEKGAVPTNLDLFESICHALHQSPKTMVAPATVEITEAIEVLRGLTLLMSSKVLNALARADQAQLDAIAAVLSSSDDADQPSRSAIPKPIKKAK